MMVVLLLAVFVLPFFSFANADTALLGLLRSGGGAGGRGVCLACLEPRQLRAHRLAQELFTLLPWRVDDDERSFAALTSPLQRTSVTVWMQRMTVEFTKAHPVRSGVALIIWVI